MSQPAAPALADPQLSSWAAAGPGLLPEPTALPAPARDDLDRVAFEIAAAVLATSALVRRYLAQQQPDISRIEAQARAAWQLHLPIWLRLAVPAIQEAYRLGHVDNVSTSELHVLATGYADKLGVYVNESSAQALADGVERQLARHWDAKVAWLRAGVAYGLERREMRAYLDGLMLASDKGGPELVPTAARALVDKALLVRADRIGRAESHTATQTGQALAWLFLYRAGRLPPGSVREWDMVETESSCAICRFLHGAQVPPDEPFLLPDGGKIWAPRVHPGCACEVALRVPLAKGALRALSKAYDPREQRNPRGGPGAGRWTRVAQAERPAAPTPAPAATEAVDTEPVSEQAPDPFAVHSPFALANPFAAANPFASRADPFALTAALPAPPADPFAAGPHPRRYIRRSVLILEPRAEVPMPPGRDSYFMDAADFFSRLDWRQEELGIGNTVDFDAANVTEAPDLAATLLPDAWNVLYRQHDTERESPEDFAAQVAWQRVISTARATWGQVTSQHGAAELVGRLEPHDLTVIAGLAGYAADESPGAMRNRIINAAEGHGAPDDSLLNAYGDYLVLVRPDLLGANGENIDLLLRDAIGDGADRETLLSHPPQVFSFAHGVHPGTALGAHDRLMPDQSYYVAGLHYHSVIGEAAVDGLLPPAVAGMQELLLKPLPENAEVIED